MAAEWILGIFGALLVGNIGLTYSVNFRLGALCTLIKTHDWRLQKLEDKLDGHKPNEADPRGAIPRHVTG